MIPTLILPLEEKDYPTAATIQHDAFAADPIDQLIWGRVEPAAGLEAQIATFREMAAEPWRTLRKAVRRRGHGNDGGGGGGEDEVEEETVAISVSGLVNAAENQKFKNDAPPAPGTDVALLDEFFGMLGSLLDEFKKRDTKFYRESALKKKEGGGGTRGGLRSSFLFL